MHSHRQQSLLAQALTTAPWWNLRKHRQIPWSEKDRKYKNSHCTMGKERFLPLFYKLLTKASFNTSPRGKDSWDLGAY